MFFLNKNPRLIKFIIIFVFLLLFVFVFCVIYFNLKNKKEISRDLDSHFIKKSEDSDFYKKDFLLPQENLPEVVAETRNNIGRAVYLKDYILLANIASPEIKYTFGEDYEGGFATWLKDQSKNNKDLFLINQLLNQPFAKQNDIYIWPAVFTKSSIDWTEEDFKNISSFATEEEIQEWLDFGAYIGFRIGIREDGKWVYYLAGD